MPKLQKGKARIPEPRELERLFKLISLSKHAKRDTLLIWLSYGLGMRALELASLKLNQVLNPDESINRDISLVRTKGNKPRMVFLPNEKDDPRIHNAIREYVKERKQYCEKKKIPFSLNQPLFLSLRGVAFSNKTLQKRFEHLYKMAGIHGASSHSGRRCFITQIIEVCGDIKAASTLAGHSSIAMTAEYVEDNPNRLKKISGFALKYI